jgi:NAD(P)-dependent dehydrogenase (short-subunit alcohol dehydrogenase family)
MNGRVVLITGAAGGLGLAVAARFATLGADLACVDRSVPNPLPDIAGQGKLAWFAGDVSDEAAVARLRDDVRDELGPVDMVFNIAGILESKGLRSTDADTFRRVMDVNVVGTHNVTRAFAADMTSRGWGRVVNVGSVASVTGFPQLAYAASKAAVAGLTRSLVHAFWGTGVTVNAVCPGPMDTPMMDPSYLDSAARKTPTGRIVQPDEVAAVFEFFAAEQSASINGQILVVDGGATSVFDYADRVIGGDLTARSC